MENQNFNDKIEERDEELTKLRARYYIAVQALAHVREKSCTIDRNIDDLNLDSMSIQTEVTSVIQNGVMAQVVFFQLLKYKYL